jgi:serine/threonine protein kinase
MIAFSCPHCGAQLQVKESLAGKTRPCPNCSQGVQAPSVGPKSGARTIRPPSDAEETVTALSKQVPPHDYDFLAPPQGPNELGRLGTYLIRKVLGTGAMGIVFEAEDSHLKRPTALKVMKPSLAAYAEFHRRFLREAQLAAAIEHEHVVTIYQVGEDRGVPFLAMKLLQGETLEDRLDRLGGRLPGDEVLRIGREIAEGLNAAHARGLIHRDIKPANIWLETGRDRVKIVDFGLARGSGADAHFTQAGAVIGTPSYMAPEQANAEEVDARCDLFSLGAVLYRTCTGRLPFDGKDTLSVLSALATKTPTAPHKIVPQVPRMLSALVMRLLAKDRDDRPQSAREVVEAIEAIERGEGVEETPAAPAIAAPPAPVEKVRDKGKAETEGEKKPPKKARSSVRRKKKRREAERDWGRVVLIASLVLLAVALVVLLFGIIHHARKNRAAAPEAPVFLAYAGVPSPISVSSRTCPSECSAEARLSCRRPDKTLAESADCSRHSARPRSTDIADRA